MKRFVSFLLQLLIIATMFSVISVSATEGEFTQAQAKALVDAGCKAFGFAEGSSVMLKLQAKKNTQLSETGVIEGHFATVDEVLDWLKEDLKL